MESVTWFMDNAYKYEDALLSWPVTIAGTVLYLVAVVLGQKVMKKYTKFELKGAMTLHNVILFVWSVAMCAGGLYETISAFRANPFLDVYCSSKNRPGSERIMTGKAWFWIWLFFASKFYEFLDTAFIVLRKSNLIFLHVYHHAVVAPLALTYLKAGMFFLNNGVIANGFIHTLMYWSYLMTTMGKPPAWKKYLTMAQLIQFVYGLLSIVPMPYVCGFGYFSWTYETLVFWFQEFVLITFFLLFMAFYNKRYDTPKKDTNGHSNNHSNGHTKKD